MKPEKENTKGRRTFLKGLLTGGVGLMATGIVKADVASAEKVKLLTPDGKLVEVDRSKIETTQHASNKDVQEWMKNSKK